MTRKYLFSMLMVILNCDLSASVALVAASFEDPNPPSCKIVAQRLKQDAVRMSELVYHIDQINKGKPLNFRDLRGMEVLSRQIPPTVFERIDQEVVLSVRWPKSTNLAVQNFSLLGPAFSS